MLLELATLFSAGYHGLMSVLITNLQVACQWMATLYGIGFISLWLAQTMIES